MYFKLSKYDLLFLSFQWSQVLIIHEKYLQSTLFEASS